MYKSACAIPGRVFSTVACAAPGRICSIEACAAPMAYAVCTAIRRAKLYCIVIQETLVNRADKRNETATYWNEQRQNRKKGLGSEHRK